MPKIIRYCALLLVSVGLVSCHALYTVVEKQDMHIETKVTHAIFLPPKHVRKPIYLQLKNSTEYRIPLKMQLVELLESRGFKVTTTLSRAHYLLQVNVRNISDMDRKQVDAYYNQGYMSEDIASGAIAGALISSPDAVGRGALIGGIVGFFANAAIHDSYVGMVVDVQLSERLKTPIKQTTVSQIKQGKYTTITKRNSVKTYWQSYQTRVISVANQINLKVIEAVAPLSNQVAIKIAGILSP